MDQNDTVSQNDTPEDAQVIEDPEKYTFDMRYLHGRHVKLVVDETDTHLILYAVDRHAKHHKGKKTFALLMQEK